MLDWSLCYLNRIFPYGSRKNREWLTEAIFQEFSNNIIILYSNENLFSLVRWIRSHEEHLPLLYNHFFCFSFELHYLHHMPGT